MDGLISVGSASRDATEEEKPVQQRTFYIFLEYIAHNHLLANYISLKSLHDFVPLLLLLHVIGSMERRRTEGSGKRGESCNK